MESVGVRFPSHKALAIFAEHGAQVDWQKQIVYLKPDLVLKALSTAPRYFRMGARDASLDLQLQDGVTYFTTDGCGVETIDFETRQRRPSCKEDVGKMARVADYLGSIGFYWPMVSAQDFKRTAPLHELDASWNNTVKHVQSETVMGESLLPLCGGNGNGHCRQPGRAAPPPAAFAGGVHHCTHWCRTNRASRAPW